MRDFYDIYILTAIRKFDAATFKTTLCKTIEKRGTAEQMAGVADAIAMVEKNPVMINLWTRYSKKYPYAGDVTWEMTMGAVKTLAVCLIRT
jgi:hypothetical protein